MNKYRKGIVATVCVFIVTGFYFYLQQDVSMTTPTIETPQQETGFKGLIEPFEFQEKIASEEYTLIDVRTPEEYSLQRIGKEALLVNFYDSDFKEQLSALDKDKKYLLYCKSGSRSAATAKIMEELGFKEFYELKGGINDWDILNLPTVNGPVQEVESETDLPLTSTSTESVSGDVDISDFTIPFVPDNPTLPHDSELNIPVVCTMDVKQCPDGSFVGRTGSNCEFVCPEKTSPEKLEQDSTVSFDSWWKPVVGLSWQWQLSGDIDTSYNIDAYDIDLEETPKTVINTLNKKGSRVICYISAGSYEDWRTDAGKFPNASIGKKYDGWAGERWLDIANYEKFADVMQNRMNLAVTKGCDAIEPDNIHGYQEDTGFVITYDDQIRYNRWLADEAHKRGLAIALKNDGQQVDDLLEYYDFVIVEECFQWDECALYTPFIKVGKPVLGVEYALSRKQFCREAEELQFSWLKMDRDLAGGRKACDDV